MTYWARGNKNKNSTSLGLCKQSNQQWMNGRPAGATVVVNRVFPKCELAKLWMHMKIHTYQSSNTPTRSGGKQAKYLIRRVTQECVHGGNHGLMNYGRWAQLKWQFPFRVLPGLRGTEGPKGGRVCGRVIIRIRLFTCFVCWCYWKDGQKQFKLSENQHLNKDKLQSALI